MLSTNILGPKASTAFKNLVDNIAIVEIKISRLKAGVKTEVASGLITIYIRKMKSGALFS